MKLLISRIFYVATLFGIALSVNAQTEPNTRDVGTPSAEALKDPTSFQNLKDLENLRYENQLKLQQNTQRGDRPEDQRFFQCVEKFAENQVWEYDRIREANTTATKEIQGITNQRFNQLSQERNDLQSINRSYQEQQREAQNDLENLSIDLITQRNQLLTEKNRIHQTCQEDARAKREERRGAIGSGEAVQQNAADLAGATNRSEDQYLFDLNTCKNDNVPAYEELKRTFNASHQALALREKQIQRNLRDMLANAKIDQAMVQFSRKQALENLDYQESLIKHTQTLAINDTKRTNISNQVLSGLGCLDENNRIKDAQDRWDPPGSSTQ